MTASAAEMAAPPDNVDAPLALRLDSVVPPVTAKVPLHTTNKHENQYHEARSLESRTKGQGAESAKTGGQLIHTQ